MHNLQNFLFWPWAEWLIGHVIKAHDHICTWSTNFTPTEVSGPNSDVGGYNTVSQQGAKLLHFC
jgi:hypothetical protein